MFAMPNHQHMSCSKLQLEHTKYTSILIDDGRTQIAYSPSNPRAHRPHLVNDLAQLIGAAESCEGNARERVTSHRGAETIDGPELITTTSVCDVCVCAVGKCITRASANASL